MTRLFVTKLYLYYIFISVLLNSALFSVELELRKEQILSDFNSKSETLELERQEIENERQKFEATKIEEGN